MKKRSAFSRIALLNEGREALLNYFRNIPLQAILLSFSFLAIYRTHQSPQHEIGLIFIALLFFAIFALAWYANTTIFHRECTEKNLGKFNKRIHHLCNTMGYSHTKRAKIVTQLIWRHKKIEIVEQFFIALILNATLAIIVMIALKGYLEIATITK